MYLQEILEVAIGLVFMWLIISVAAMSIQEWIANLLEWRANDLENAIRKMLANPDLAKEFYNHQIIRGLSKDKNWWETFRMWFENLFRRLFKKSLLNELKPSYIPATDFALTVFDLVLQAGSEASPVKIAFEDMRTELNTLALDRMNFEDRQEALKFLDDMQQQAKRIASTNIGFDSMDTVLLPIARFAEDHPGIKDSVYSILLDQLDRYYKALLEEQSKYPPDEINKDLNLKRLRMGLLAIEKSSPKLHQSLRSLLTGVEEYADYKEMALAIARKNVEDWFNNSMTRLSGWYKRKAMLVAFIIGLLLAILLNVDSILVSTSLWREPTLRQSIVAQAQSYAQLNQQLPASGTETLPPQKTVLELEQELTALKIPFGWETELYIIKAGETCQIIPLSKNAVWGIWFKDACKRITNAPVDSTGWLSKFAGILISGLAVAQGAPFWFDILKKFVNVRSSGANPAEQKPAG
jgi:hypothetical protein